MHLNQEMTPEENDTDILQKLSPTLFDEKRGVDDAPPEGYFEEFPDRLMDHIGREQVPDRRSWTARVINFRNVAAAAAVALILALVPYLKSVFDEGGQNDGKPDGTALNSQTTQPATPMTDAEATDEVLATYISDADLYAAVDAEGAYVDIALPESDTESIIDYLLDEDVSSQIIIETLKTEDS